LFERIVDPRADGPKYRAYVERSQGPRYEVRLAVYRTSHEIVGLINTTRSSGVLLKAPSLSIERFLPILIEDRSAMGRGPWQTSPLAALLSIDWKRMSNLKIQNRFLWFAVWVFAWNDFRPTILKFLVAGNTISIGLFLSKIGNGASERTE
jgi:hypothetical protein